MEETGSRSLESSSVLPYKHLASGMAASSNPISTDPYRLLRKRCGRFTGGADFGK